MASQAKPDEPEIVEQEGEEEAEAEAEIADGEENNVEDEEEEEGEGEYEVAAIVDHKMQAGKTTYLVAWKGYGAEHNTWEPEAHVSHASDIVKAYWERQPKKQVDAVRKRSRQSAGSVTSTTPGSNAKRAKTTNGTGVRGQPAKKISRGGPANGASKRSAPIDVDDDDEEEAPDFEKTHVDSLAKYEDVKDWEELVASVDTIERGSENKLIVYLTMTGGEKVASATEVAYARCPQKLLQFYEAHLKWKMAEA